MPIRRLRDGIPNAVLREVKALEQVEHENVVSLLEVFPHGTGIALIFEFMLSDLAAVIRNLRSCFFIFIFISILLSLSLSSLRWLANLPL